MSKASRLVAADQPSLREALSADIDFTLQCRAEGDRIGRPQYRLREFVRLTRISDAFFAQFCYRARTALAARGVPVLPLILHRISMMLGQVCIGDPVIIGPGLYLAHGQVVIDGLVRIGQRTVIFPWSTIGLRAGNWTGPTIGNSVTIGSGARVLGAICIGDRASIGANAVVLDNVPKGSTVVGVPARDTKKP